MLEASNYDLDAKDWADNIGANIHLLKIRAWTDEYGFANFDDEAGGRDRSSVQLVTLAKPAIVQWRLLRPGMPY